MSKRNSALMGATLALALILHQPAIAGVPLAIGGETQEVPTLAPMLERVTPGVVNIAVRGHVATQANPLFQDPFFRKFFGAPEQHAPATREFRAAGSGVVVDAEKGYVITNNHVVQNAEEITVTLRDGRQMKATIVGTDPEADVAVIEIPPENLTGLPLGDSAALKVGDFVVAVGNPFGLGQTVTSGIVSALGRSGLGIEGFEDFIQTDASINPGNSGGALVNLRGELIGINTAIVGPSGGNVGIGFAIPIDMARAIMRQLIEHGEVRRGLLGVQIQNVTSDIAEALNLDSIRGAIVARVEPGSSADKAGFKAGDVITAVNGEPVENASDLRNKIGLARVGETVKLDLVRGDENISLTAVLSPRRHARLEAGDIDRRLAGTTFGAIEEGSPLFGRVEGVEALEIQIGSPAWQAGLRIGDVITSVDRRPVKTPEELADAVRANSDLLLLRVRRGETALFITIR